MTLSLERRLTEDMWLGGEDADYCHGYRACCRSTKCGAKPAHRRKPHDGSSGPVCDGCGRANCPRCEAITEAEDALIVAGRCFCPSCGVRK